MSDSPAARMMSSLTTTASQSSQQWLSSDQAQDASSSVQSQADPQLGTPQIQDVISDQAESTELNNQQKLATFEAILSELEAQKEPQPPQQYSSSGLNREIAPGPMPDYSELPGGMQQVESEPSPEIPPELETYLQKIEETKLNIAKDVIAAAAPPTPDPEQTLPQHVKVLPVTKDQIEAGKKKNTSYAIRWLIMFSEKMASMFKGKAVYRPE